MNQLKLTAEEAEKYVGVDYISTFGWGKTVIQAANGLRVFLVMRGVSFVALGITGGIIAAMFGVLGWVSVFISLGMPVAQAKDAVSRKAIAMGFSIGAVMSLFGYRKQLLTEFIDRTMGADGVTPGYMSGVHRNAYNTGLVLGYSAAARLSFSEKKKFRDLLTGALIKRARAAKRKLYIQNWSDRELILRYAAVLQSD